MNFRLELVDVIEELLLDASEHLTKNKTFSN